MAANVIGQGWLADNLTRAYPLAPFATRADVTGTFVLPDDFLVSLYFPTGPELAIDPTRFYIQAVGVFATGYSVTLGYADGGAGVAVASATISAAAAAATEFMPVTLKGRGDFSGSTGKLVVGRTLGIGAQPAGLFTFAPAATQLDVDCIRPQLRGVASITIVDGVDVGAPLHGDVRLTLGANIQLSSQGSTLRIDAIKGAGLNTACVCGNDPVTATPISTINGVPADDEAFEIVAGDCVRLTPQAAGLLITDTCSTPCCGCAESEALRSALDFVADENKSLRDLANRLAAEVAKMTDVVIASKVSDTGCVTCA